MRITGSPFIISRFSWWDTSLYIISNYQYQNEAQISHMNMLIFTIQNTKLAKFPAFLDEVGRCLAFTAFEKQTREVRQMLIEVYRVGAISIPLTRCFPLLLLWLSIIFNENTFWQTTIHTITKTWHNYLLNSWAPNPSKPVEEVVMVVIGNTFLNTFDN